MWGTLVSILLSPLLPLVLPSRPSTPENTLLGIRHSRAPVLMFKDPGSTRLPLTHPLCRVVKRLCIMPSRPRLNLALHLAFRRVVISDLAGTRDALRDTGSTVALTTLVFVLTFPTTDTEVKLVAQRSRTLMGTSIVLPS